MADPPYTATEPEEPGTRDLRFSDAHRHQSATGIPPADPERPHETGLPQSRGKDTGGEAQGKRDPLKFSLPGDILELADTGQVIHVATVSQDSSSVRYTADGGLSTYDHPVQYWEGFVKGAKVLKAADPPFGAVPPGETGIFPGYSGKPERTTQFELDQHEFLRSHETRRTAAARHVEPVYDPEHTPQSDSGETEHADQKRADKDARDRAKEEGSQAKKQPDSVPKDAMPEDAKQREPRFRDDGKEHKQPDTWPKSEAEKLREHDQKGKK